MNLQIFKDIFALVLSGSAEIRYDREIICYKLFHNDFTTIEFVDFFRHCIVRSYYKDEQLHRRFNYKDGKMDGIVERWYDDGKLMYEYNYKNGKPNGVCRGWYCSGQVHYERNYKSGILVYEL